MEQFIDDYGIYFTLLSMVLLAFVMVLPCMPRKKRKEKQWSARFVCFLCKGYGETKYDIGFACPACDGLGIISYPVRFGYSIYHEYTSKLDFIAKLGTNQRKRFIGFQSIKDK